ncbi:hypothetical protein Cgig2_020328 [Carnegiea gigantea]|uniref:Uncharacterized protein n=1 Tax=Carnegiea gigantea TaxID=171969 RepID=A0A9Q1KD23_9CARY|nr:hypothetical protein Cgig2_020328 [Carnegiea gigantea]
MDDYSYFCDLEHEAQHKGNGQQQVHLNEVEIDETSIIEETAESIRQLEEQVKSLEQQVRGKRKGREKGAIGNYSNGNRYMITSSASASASASSMEMDTSTNNPPLEVKAKVSEKEMLVTIHSKRNHHLLPNILSEMASLHLSPSTTNLIPFGNYAMVITIIAKMDDEFCMTVKDLVKHLRQTALQQLLSP